MLFVTSYINWISVVWFLLGICFTLLLQCVLFYLLCIRGSSNHQNVAKIPTVDIHTFPDRLLELIGEKPDGATKEGTILLNLLLQFWFHENRYDISTLEAIGNRINSELTELLTNTPLGKIFNSLKIHDIELGSESPTISSICLKNVNMNKELSVLNSFEFEFDLNYSGGFYMSIDAMMKFSTKCAFVSVRVVKCIGRVRVEFTRLPFTYWSVSFVDQPELEFSVETRLEGHNVPQLNRIISVQLRRRINRKFVMPDYKIRMKPFLPKYRSDNFRDDSNLLVPTGVLYVNVLSVSRLPYQEGTISCTLIIDSDPWIEDDGQVTSNHSHILQIFKRTNKDISEVRKYSAGSSILDRYQDGLRQRLRSIAGQDITNVLNSDEVGRRKSYTDSSMLSSKDTTDDTRLDGCIQHTKHLPYDEIIAFNESFQFTVNPPMRFLNILVWCNKSETNTSNSLIGYVSLPLVTEMCVSGVGRKCRLFYLKPSSRNRITDHQSLVTHPGFDPTLCNGDVTLGVKFTSCNSPSASSECTPTSLSPSKTAIKNSALLESVENLSDVEFDTSNTHEFEKIAVTKPIGCDFCAKRIWFKDALRCGRCGYTCHKKCVSKCEKTECSSVHRTSTTDQLAFGVDALDLVPSSSCVAPEIITTGPDTNNISDAKNKLSTFFANVKGGVRRSGSTSSLAPPTTTGSTEPVIQSHSLPHTPNQSPPLSRKSSLTCDAFFQSTENENEVEIALSSLLSLPQTESTLECVKISGKKLCVDLLPSEREIRINDMILKIKKKIDTENKRYEELQDETRNATDNTEITKLAFEVGKCEERLQALTNLLLHCCSGLQDSHDATTSSYLHTEE